MAAFLSSFSKESALKTPPFFPSPLNSYPLPPPPSHPALGRTPVPGQQNYSRPLTLVSNYSTMATVQVPCRPHQDHKRWANVHKQGEKNSRLRRAFQRRTDPNTLRKHSLIFVQLNAQITCLTSCAEPPGLWPQME